MTGDTDSPTYQMLIFYLQETYVGKVRWVHTVTCSSDYDYVSTRILKI